MIKTPVTLLMRQRFQQFVVHEGFKHSTERCRIANLVIWPKIFKKHRRIILGARMFSVRGRIQRDGEVVHLVAHRLADMTAELATVGKRDSPFPLPHGRGDEFYGGAPSPDPRGMPPKGLPTRDIYIPDLHIDRLRVKPRNFR